MLQPGMTLSSAFETIERHEDAPPDIFWLIDKDDPVVRTWKRYHTFIEAAVRHGHVSFDYPRRSDPEVEREDRLLGRYCGFTREPWGSLVLERRQKILDVLNSFLVEKFFNPIFNQLPDGIVRDEHFEQRYFEMFYFICREVVLNAIEHGSDYGVNGPINSSVWFAPEGFVVGVEQPAEWSFLDTHFLSEGIEEDVLFTYKDGIFRGSGRTNVVRPCPPWVWCEPLSGGGTRTVVCAPKDFLCPEETPWWALPEESADNPAT